MGPARDAAALLADGRRQRVPAPLRRLHLHFRFRIGLHLSLCPDGPDLEGD